jgi:hypothetical protein
VLDRRTGLRRVALAIVCALLGLTLIALRTVSRAEAPVAAAAPETVPMPDSLRFQVRYTGLGAEGVDMVWRGEVQGEAPGQVTIRMEYAGPAAGRRAAVWPVNVWLFFSADDLRTSFAAELSGRMHWGTGEMRVTGLVSDGVRVDTPIEQRMQVDQPGLEGRVTVRFYPRLAVGGRQP